MLLKRFDNDYKFLKSLEAANIIADTALRFGTSEVTRRGMRQNEMRYIAELIASIYNARKTKSFKIRVGKVKKEIEDLATRYNRIAYAFNLN